ncbi:PREDICTED: DNA polymerase alpha subunit B [Cyphomyrmex costatus]|uniref:DNA polymerase alpha subunit B n=1 Tax=Cyphomyrmex costatus TaxID=456900 RepID=A0A195CMJ9_9HYME|nr:PREDICTED: DNA polymerase alpha subunit B [Cyphomyrmex costatus]KYN01294.1 DNA polymerase alpha subunit B [Cyphomyrmex costatus]
MEDKESLRKLFLDLGCEIENDVVFDKCFEFCNNYDVDLDKLTELWVTFCVNNDADIQPTIDNLIKMEHMILKKDYKLDHTSHYNKNIDNDDVLSMYGCTESGRPSKRARRSPEVEIDADTQVDKIKAAEYSFSPATCTEKSSVSSQQHQVRNVTDKEKILLSVGETVSSWKKTDYEVQVTKSDEPHIPSDARYMYEILSKQGHILTSVCQNLGNRLFKTWLTTTNNGIELRYVKNVRCVSQTNFRTFGRINTNKDSTNTVTLEGSTRRKGISGANTIELDFRNLKQYSVFSGQIVAVEAVNPVGDTLYVKEIFTKSYASPAVTPMIESKLNIFIAAGSFTPSSNMHYQALWDLMEKVASDEPNVLILIGPFLEYTHPEIQDNIIKDTHHELFEKILIKIMESTRRNTQVILVASNRDVHQEPIFPTPHYTIFNRKLLQNYSNLRLMPDPCILDIAGLKIGITSVDVIKHIGKEEISNVSGDRLSRLADHVLSQTCFYPVYPPFEDLNVDTELWEKYAFFDQQPHLLVLPSDMRCYCKVINDCMIVNPERMHKHTYARLSVKPVIGGKWSSNNISCEIAKV